MVAAADGRNAAAVGRETDVVLIGHSWGGDSALKAASKLAKDGYNVSLLATLDPVTDTVSALAGRTVDEKRPDRKCVLTHWNWHQQQTKAFGSRFKDADKNELWNPNGTIRIEKGPDKGKVAGHREIDDDLSIRDQIKKKSIEIHDEWKQRQKK